MLPITGELGHSLEVGISSYVLTSWVRSGWFQAS